MGSAEAIPNTDFHGEAGASFGLAPITMVDLQYAIDRLSGRFHLTAKRGSDASVVYVAMPYNTQQIVSIQVRTQPSSEMRNAAVCSYQFQGPQNVTIFVSTCAHHDHLERALTHELSEINFALHLQLKHGIEPTLAEKHSIYENTVLTPSDKALRQRLTPHDIGRISELDYVFGVRGGGGMDAKQQWATLTHLGMANDNSDAEKRISLLKYLPKELIDPRTVKHIQLRLSSPLQPSIAPAPLRTSQQPEVAERPPIPNEASSTSTDPSKPKEESPVPSPNDSIPNESNVAAFHQDISTQLAGALDMALDARQVWMHYQNELQHAEDNYAQAAGTTGKALKAAEARCKSIADTLKEVRAQSVSSSEIVGLQVALRQAHFELGQIRQSHNKSISESEVRNHQRRIQVAHSKEEKAQKENVDALVPVIRLILTTLDIRRQPEVEWAKHSLLNVRMGWRATDETLRERIGTPLTVAVDTKEDCLRLQRDLQSIAQQLERVEGRNNNQRQVDSLSNRQIRVGQELERAKRKLDRAIRAYREVWSEEEVTRLRAESNAWADRFNALMQHRSLQISTEEMPRTTTRAARLQAIERQIQATLEHLLSHAEKPLNRFLDEWAKPDGDLAQEEDALTRCLDEDIAWEWREQLTDMNLQRESLLYPNPIQVPNPDTFTT